MATVVAALLLTLVVGLVGLFTGLWGPLRYREFRQVQAAFEEIPGVKVIDAWGNEDVTFEDIGVTVELAGKGRISFLGVTPASFDQDGDRYISVRQVGPYFFSSCSALVRADGTLDGGSYGASINLGPEGDFRRHLPFAARRVQDVIANYDALVAALESLPRYPAFLEVPCVTTWEDGTTGACIRTRRRDGGLSSERAVTRLTISDEPGVLHACEARPLTVEEERAHDRAVQSLQWGFHDHPPGERAPAEEH